MELSDLILFFQIATDFESLYIFVILILLFFAMLQLNLPRAYFREAFRYNSFFFQNCSFLTDFESLTTSIFVIFERS